MEEKEHHHSSHPSEEHPMEEMDMEHVALEHETMDHATMDHAALGHGAETKQAAHAEHAHTDHTGHEALFRQRFWVSLLLSIPVLLYSPVVQQLLGFRMPEFPGSRWIEPVFSIIVFLYGGVPFLQMAAPELKNRQPGMMTLISLAITVAFVYSLATLFLPTGVGEEAMGFFWELVTLIDIMLLGHWLEMRSVRQASGALNELARLMPDTAERIRPDGGTEEVPVSRLRVNDLVLVRPGASIPADGVVVEGASEVNEAMITGESKPVGKDTGDRVIAGTINGDGSLRVRVTAVGNETALAGIMRLVAEAQRSKSRTQVLADRAAGWLFYIALGVAILTAIAWILATGFNVAVIERVATVLVIACPHALGLAIPLVVAITTALGASHGILVRDRLALEEARLVDTVIFDKTGTLTKGEFGVVGMAVAEGWDENEALALAAAIEGDSEHTIARGIRRSAEERGLALPEVSEFEAIKGRGVRARWQGREGFIGGPRLLESLGLSLPEPLAGFERSASAKGQSVVHLVVDGQPAASFALADVVRPESKEAVRRLHAMGVEVAMLTGDSQAVARAVAEELGIGTYFAEVLPEHKDQKVAEIQRQGKRVAMVGDGVNDAPALTRADIGIAIGSGTDVAVESAGIILVRSNPLDIVNIIQLSRASYRKMIQNLAWATGYNVVALPLAAGVLAPWGILLSPAMGALLMSVSTIIVALNAQLLRGQRMRLISLFFVLSLILVACSPAQPISGPMQTSSSDILSNPTAVPPTAASVEANPTSTQPSGSAGQPSSSEDLLRMDEQGAVTVEVTPVNLTKPGDTIEFVVGLNTHSVDLSMDLAPLATLTTDTGKMVQASQWDAPLGGHHVSGKLVFPAEVDGQPLLDGARTLTLTIQNLDVPERVFSWDLTP